MIMFRPSLLASDLKDRSRVLPHFRKHLSRQSEIEQRSEPWARQCRAPVHLACSRGGHLDLLLRHQAAFEGCRVVWVTQQSARAERLRKDGAEVDVLGEWDRSTLLRSSVGAIWSSLGLVLRQRPRVVVTSGSGMVVPFCLMARLLGARLIFIETAARVRGASSSGRVLSRVAHDVIAQWIDMLSVYRNATIARASVVEELTSEPSAEGVGTFVAVGTHSQPFDRLLKMIDRAVGTGVLPEPVFAQVGPSQQGVRRARVNAMITPEELELAVSAARHVVCHAGTGTIATALRAGRRPLVLARLSRYGEHFDDHQQQIIDKLASLDLVVPLRDEITASDVERAAAPLVSPPELQRLPLLLDCLRERIQQVLLDVAPAGG